MDRVMKENDVTRIAKRLGQIEGAVWNADVREFVIQKSNQIMDIIEDMDGELEGIDCNPWCEGEPGEPGVSPLRQASPATSPVGGGQDAGAPAEPKGTEGTNCGPWCKGEPGVPGVCPICGSAAISRMFNEKGTAGWFCQDCGFDGDDCGTCREMIMTGNFVVKVNESKRWARFCPMCGKPLPKGQEDE